MQLDLYPRWHERCLHRYREPSYAIRTYATSAVGIDVVSGHTVSYRIQVVSDVHIHIMSGREILQNRIWYDKIAEFIARYK